MKTFNLIEMHNPYHESVKVYETENRRLDYEISKRINIIDKLRDDLIEKNQVINKLKADLRAARAELREEKRTKQLKIC